MTQYEKSFLTRIMKYGRAQIDWSLAPNIKATLDEMEKNGTVVYRYKTNPSWKGAEEVITKPAARQKFVDLLK